MTEPTDAARDVPGRPAENIPYPTNHVVGVVTPDDVGPVVDALTDVGFATSEIVIGAVSSQ